jgi:hypothetical protein
MRRSNFALRVPPTLLAEARKAAESEGVALNQLITLALAEKVSAVRTEEYFEERARRADPTIIGSRLKRCDTFWTLRNANAILALSQTASVGGSNNTGRTALGPHDLHS